MTTGDKVTIYIDPVTQGLEEGKAELVAKSRDDDEFEWWMVRFLDDGFEAERKIRKVIR